MASLLDRVMVHTFDGNVAPPSIRHLAAHGLSQREIAGKLGLTRYQVRKALAA